MDPFEFTALPEEFTPLSRETAEPPEEFPAPIPTEVSYQGARREKRRRLKKMFVLLSAAGVITVFSILPGAALPLPPPETGVPVQTETRPPETPPKEPEPDQQPQPQQSGLPASTPDPGPGQEPQPDPEPEPGEPVQLQTQGDVNVDTEAVPVPGFAIPEIAIPYAALVKTDAGRSLRFTYAVTLNDAGQAEAQLSARDDTGAEVSLPASELWDGQSRSFQVYSIDVSDLGEEVTLVITARFEALGEEHSVTASTLPVSVSGEMETAAQASVAESGGGLTLAFSASIRPAADDPYPYHFQPEYFVLHWFAQQEDGSMAARGGTVITELPELEEDGSGGWLIRYSGSVEGGLPAEDVTHFEAVMELADYELLIPCELKTAVLEAERLLGDRLLQITVLNSSNPQTVQDARGRNVSAPEVLEQVEMNELEFTGYVPPVPQQAARYAGQYTFVGYVLHSPSDEEDEPGYTAWVGFELTPEMVGKAPIRTVTDPDTGEVTEVRSIVLEDMWICTVDAKGYFVILDANGGRFENGQTTQDFNVRGPLDRDTTAWTAYFPVPQRPGYTFTGWYADPDCTDGPLQRIPGVSFWHVEQYPPFDQEEFTAQYDFSDPDFDYRQFYRDMWEAERLAGTDYYVRNNQPLRLYAGWEPEQ